MISFFSPNTTSNQLKIFLKSLFWPFGWYSGNHDKSVEEKMRLMLGVQNIRTIDSARSALFLILRELELDSGDEVIVQAFTCAVVLNPIIANGLKPIYADIDESNFNTTLEDIKSRVTAKTKVIIIQHTFGVPFEDIIELRELCDEKKIFLIEDCAHVIDYKFHHKQIGTYGDASVFSFGADKTISSTRGGALYVNEQFLFNKIDQAIDELPKTSKRLILQHILHPIIFRVSLPIYNFLKIGKLILFLSRKLELITRFLVKEEKNGKMNVHYPTKYAPVLARTLLSQLNDLEMINKHRVNLSNIYFQELRNIDQIRLPDAKHKQLLRFTFLTEDRDSLMRHMKSRNILLGNWYDTVIAPKGVDYKTISYEIGSCIIAEKVASQCVNLPTSINTSEEDAYSICKLLKEYYE